MTLLKSAATLSWPRAGASCRTIPASQHSCLIVLCLTRCHDPQSRKRHSYCSPRTWSRESGPICATTTRRYHWPSNARTFFHRPSEDSCKAVGLAREHFGWCCNIPCKQCSAYLSRHSRNIVAEVECCPSSPWSSVVAAPPTLGHASSRQHLVAICSRGADDNACYSFEPPWSWQVLCTTRSWSRWWAYHVRAR